MTLSALGRSSIAALSAVCLAAPVATSDFVPRAVESGAAGLAPVLTSLVLPGDYVAGAAYPRAAQEVGFAAAPAAGNKMPPDVSPTAVGALPSDAPYVMVGESGLEFVGPGRGVDASGTPLKPVDYINAFAAAAWLVFAVPTFVITVPIQIFIGGEASIVKSLNQIIAQVNVILKLVGGQISPIPTETSTQDAEILSAATESDDREERDVAVPVTDEPSADDDAADGAAGAATNDATVGDAATAGDATENADDTAAQETDEAESVADEPIVAADAPEGGEQTEPESAEPDADTEPKDDTAESGRADGKVATSSSTAQ